MVDIEVAKGPDGEPHFLDDLHDALGMYEEVDMGDDVDESELASVTEIAAFIENANSRMGGGEQ